MTQLHFYGAGLELLFWIVSGIVLYVLLFLFEGKAVKGRLSVILSGLSLLAFVRIAFMLIALVSAFAIVPDFLGFMQSLKGPQTTTNMVVQELLRQDINTGLADVLFPILVIVGIALLVLAALIAYHTIACSGVKNRGKRLVLLAVFVLLTAILQSLL